MAYIENIRILLVLLVILHHGIVGYGAGSGSWYYNNPENIQGSAWTFFTAIWLLNQAFFMGFFFFLSGYFLPPSLGKRGGRRFLTERATRLGIPLACYVLFVNPLMVYPAWVQKANFQGSMIDYLRLYLQKYRAFDVGVLWFVELLLLFTIVTLVLDIVLTSSAKSHLQGFSLLDSPSVRAFPSNLQLLFFAAGMAIICFADRTFLYRNPILEFLGIPRGHFVQYLLCFGAGMLAYRWQWLSSLSVRQGRFWCAIAVALIPLFFAVVITANRLNLRLNPYSPESGWSVPGLLGYSMLESFFCVAMIISCLHLFRIHFDWQSSLLRQLSNSSYGIYLLHAPIVTLGILLLGQLHLPPIVKLFLVVCSTICVCFSIVICLRRTRLGSMVL